MKVDPKLARGLALAELRKLLRDRSPQDDLPLTDHRHPVGAALKPIVWRYATGRLPDEAFTSRVLAAIDSYFDGRPGNVVSRKVDDPDSRQRTYVHVSASGTEHRPLAQIRIATLDMDKYDMHLHDRVLIEVTGHALERFHQRTCAGLRRDILGQLARASLRRIALLDILAIFSGVGSNTRFAVALEDGLALATLNRDPLSRQNVTLSQPFENGSHSERLPPPRKMAGVVRIATFIGPREMTRNQVRLRDELVAFESRWAADLGLMSRLSSNPLSTSMETMRSGGIKTPLALKEKTAAFEKRIETLLEELFDILERDEFMVAMGNHPPVANEEPGAPSP